MMQRAANQQQQIVAYNINDKGNILSKKMLWHQQ
jgi:hypothetical protein